MTTRHAAAHITSYNFPILTISANIARAGIKIKGYTSGYCVMFFSGSPTLRFHPATRCCCLHGKYGLVFSIELYQSTDLPQGVLYIVFAFFVVTNKR